jgi:type IV secretion system protein VirB10
LYRVSYRVRRRSNFGKKFGFNQSKMKSMGLRAVVSGLALACLALPAQETKAQEIKPPPAPASAPPERQRLTPAEPKPVNERLPDGGFLLKTGTRIPLRTLTSVSTKNAAPGDQIYLETIFPLFVERVLIVPTGSYVVGTVTESRRPGKVKGRGELYLRFDTLQLPNGAAIPLNGRIGSIDAENPGQLSREEGKVTSDGSAGRDAAVVGGTALGGAAMGNWIGGQGKYAGIGAGAGAAAGLAAILLTRGPDATLNKGTTLEMIFSHDLKIAASELEPGPAGASGFAPRGGRPQR